MKHTTGHWNALFSRGESKCVLTNRCKLLTDSTAAETWDLESVLIAEKWAKHFMGN